MVKDEELELSKDINPAEFIEGADTGEPVGTPEGEPEIQAEPLRNTPLKKALDKLALTVINAKFLTAPTDSKVTIDEITECGFSESLLDVVDYYLPSVPINHPLSAIAMAGLGLVLLVNSKKNNNTTITPETFKEIAKTKEQTGTEKNPYLEAQKPNIVEGEPFTHREAPTVTQIDKLLQDKTGTKP